MDQFIVQLPYGFKAIQDILLRKDWIITSYDTEPDELYNPGNYLYNKMKDDVVYKLYIDRNIFSFLISSVKKSKPRKIYREAIALITFCQVAEILIEPCFAVYEKINYIKNTADEAVDELILFRKVDDTSNNILINYALSNVNSLKINTSDKDDKNELIKLLTKYEWLTEWKSLYLIVLKLVYINCQDISTEFKANKFFNWMVEEFRLSLVSTVYAIFLFSSKRMKRMIKFKENDAKDKKKLQLKNMTWDLYYMNNYFREWQKKDMQEEFLFASDDKIIKEVLRASILVQKKQSLLALGNYLNSKEETWLNQIDNIISRTDNRVYGSKEWTSEYRESLIKEKEALLFR